MMMVMIEMKMYSKYYHDNLKIGRLGSRMEELR